MRHIHYDENINAMHLFEEEMHTEMQLKKKMFWKHEILKSIPEAWYHSSWESLFKSDLAVSLKHFWNLPGIYGITLLLWYQEEHFIPLYIIYFF